MGGTERGAKELEEDLLSGTRTGSGKLSGLDSSGFGLGKVD